jgi:hypothetical protein
VIISWNFEINHKVCTVTGGTQSTLINIEKSDMNIKQYESKINQILYN